MQKATGAQAALEEARETLLALQSGGGAKRQEWEGLKNDLSRAKTELSKGEMKLEVRRIRLCHQLRC